LIISLLVLSLLAIVTGYVFGKFVLGTLLANETLSPPSLSNGAPENEQDNLEEPAAPNARLTFELPQLTIYRLQVGSFQNRENALALVAELDRAGFPAYVTELAPYQVGAGVYGMELAAKARAGQLQALGYDVFVKDLAIGGTGVTLSGATEQQLTTVKNALQQLATVIAEQGDLWAQVEDGTLNRDRALQVLGEQEEILRTCHTELLGANLTTQPLGQIPSLLELAITEVFEWKAMVEKGEPDHYVTAMNYYMQLSEDFRTLCDGLHDLT